MSLLFHGLFIELISHTPNGQDPLWLSIILLDCLSKPPDMDIDGPRRDEGLAAPDTIEKLVPVEHAAGVLNKEAQKFELFERELHQFSADEYLISGKVDFKRPLLVGSGGFRSRFGLRAAEYGSHPCNHLPGTEGLGEVIIRSHFEPDDAVRLGSFCGEHEDG